jgi:hypothetical protein
MMMMMMVNTCTLQLIVLENDIIDNSIILGVTRLRHILESNQFIARASMLAAKTNSTASNEPWPTVQSIIEMSNDTLDTVERLRPNVHWIKSKANRVTFGIVQDYATQYGFYR